MQPLAVAGQMYPQQASDSDPVAALVEQEVGGPAAAAVFLVVLFAVDDTPDVFAPSEHGERPLFQAVSGNHRVRNEEKLVGPGDDAHVHASYLAERPNVRPFRESMEESALLWPEQA